MTLRFSALPSDEVARWRAGGPDAYGLPPETYGVSDGSGFPCRHCLGQVPEGEQVLVLAARPFPSLQPYAETGPIFLCAKDCAQGGGEDLPAMFGSPEYLLKGYSAEDRIVYGTGRIVPTGEIIAACAAILEDARVAYVHIRSARNNCYHCRVDRA